MPFTATTFNSGAAPGIDAPALNNLGTQFLEATNSFEQDFLSAFVLSGFTAAKDGTTASQLDVAAGVAFPLQTDGTLRRRSANALTYSTVGHASTTMYLDLNPDGTWSWNTAHSGVANYLPICSVTTDASANIATVTDARVTSTTIFPNMVGTLKFIKFSSDAGAISSDGSGVLSATTFVGTIKDTVGAASALAMHDTGATMQFKPTATNRGLLFSTRDSGGVLHNGMTIDTSGNTTMSGNAAVTGTSSLDNGAITTDGSGNVGFTLGPTFTSRQSGALNGFTFLTWSGTAGINALSVGGDLSNSYLVSIDPTGVLYLGGGGTGSGIITPKHSGATANGLTFQSWTGAALVAPLSIGGQFHSALSWFDNSGNLNGGAGTGLPVTRNNAAGSVPIYTGTTAPTSPPTGAIWIDA